MANADLTTVEELFGMLEDRMADPGRSVYSPGAYLSDLLQLLEVHFGRADQDANAPGFFTRRGDVENIMLNGEQAFTTLPYLDIVNSILEAKIKAEEPNPAIANEQNGPYGRLRESGYPFHLPFDFEDSRYQKFLSFTKAKSHEIYRAYEKEQEEVLIIAREYLGLSKVLYDFLAEIPTDPKAWLQKHYGFASDTTLAEMHETLGKVEDFLQITGVNGDDLRMLLYQNLNFTTEPSEESRAAQAFLNHNTTETDYAFVPLNEGNITAATPENIIQWGSLPADNPDSIRTSDWYKRLYAAVRLLRLSAATGISTVDLNTILTQCCHNRLDNETLHLIAVVKYISDIYDQPIDAVCGMVAGLSDRGQGHGSVPEDLFNRTFNTPFVSFEKTYLQISSHVPKGYEDYHKLVGDATVRDILNSANQDYRRRVQRALGMSERDFYYVVNRFRVKFHNTAITHPLAADQPLSEGGLSLLYRVSRLVQWMEISYPDFFHLMEVLDRDPALRSFSPFTLLLPLSSDTTDSFEIIQGGSNPQQPFSTVQAISEGLWLVQLLLSMGKWMEKSDLTGQELKTLLTGGRLNPTAEKLYWSTKWTTEELVAELKELEEKEDTAANQRTIQFLDHTYQAFKPTLAGPVVFQGNHFSTRAARNIYHCLRNDGKLVDPADARVLRFSAAAAARFASTALQNLEVIEQHDFLDLGIANRLADKLHRNLIIKGYLDADGRLLESAFPDEVADFRINFTAEPENKQLFDILHTLHRTASQQQGEEVELALFPSDLAEINLSEQQQTELYDNLIFNGYLDADGNVLQPDFFANRNNLADFEASSKLQVYAPRVYELIQASRASFSRARLKLDKQIFADLPLKPLEQEELLVNLTFNGYLNALGEYTDKAAILALMPEDFLLEARMHYHHGEAVLSAMQAQIAELKSSYYGLTMEELLPLSEEIVAEMIYSAVESQFLHNHRWKAHLRDALYDPTQAEKLELPPHFDANDRAPFAQIHMETNRWGQTKLRHRS